MTGPAARSRAVPVLAAFLASLAVSIILQIFFEPEVQTVSAEELAARRGRPLRSVIPGQAAVEGVDGR